MHDRVGSGLGEHRVDGGPIGKIGDDELRGGVHGGPMPQR